MPISAIRFSILLVPLIAGVMSSCELVVAQSMPSPQDQFRRLAGVTSLNDVAMAPWHMKMEVQLYDDKGAAKDKGTIEEWWSGPRSYKIVYDTPIYAATQVQTPDGIFVSDGRAFTPYLLSFVAHLVVRPMPLAVDPADLDVSVVSSKVGSANLSCFRVRSTTGTNPMTMPPRSYCTLPGKDDLLVSEDFETEIAKRTRFGRFRDRAVALDVLVAVAGKSAVSAHVVSLQGQTAHPAELDLSGLEKQPERLNADDVAEFGQNLSKVPPVYPPLAKIHHVSGTVVVAAIIDTSGKIKFPEVVSDPGLDLADAAVAAVRQWTYQPTLMNGKPVEVETVVSVHFNLARQ